MRIRGLEIRRFNVYQLYELKHRQSYLKAPFSIEDIVYSAVDQNNIGDIAQDVGEKVFKEFKKLLGRGDRGYYVYHNGRVIACGWAFFNLKANKVRKNYIDIPKGFVWLHNFWTHPEFRGKGIYPTLLNFFCCTFDNALISSAHNILIDSYSDNIASNKGISKANFKPIGIINGVRIYRTWLTLRETYKKNILF